MKQPLWSLGYLLLLFVVCVLANKVSDFGIFWLTVLALKGWSVYLTFYSTRNANELFDNLEDARDQRMRNRDEVSRETSSLPTWLVNLLEWLDAHIPRYSEPSA